MSLRSLKCELRGILWVINPNWGFPGGHMWVPWFPGKEHLPCNPVRQIVVAGDLKWLRCTHCKQTRFM